MAQSQQLDKLLQQADALRHDGHWAQAAEVYGSVLKISAAHPGAGHNLALCWLVLGRHEESAQLAKDVLTQNPSRWQTSVIFAKAAAGIGKKQLSLQLLRWAFQRYPRVLQIRLELATAFLHHAGDAFGSRELATPLLGDPNLHQDAQALVLVSQLYDRDASLSAQSLSQAFIAYQAGSSPAPPKSLAFQVPGKPRARRPRLGLMSIQFHASPVYFLTIGALRELAKEVDLVFFSRGQKVDWATPAFQACATEWIDLSQHDETNMARLLAQLKLDALIDLSGWMDPAGLRALAGRPVQRQYKWVGGQSVTTGMSCFDGFFSDAEQSPISTQALYSEPLLLLDGGYTSYTAPDWLPKPRVLHDGVVHLGVIANPVKVSRAFLQDLNRRVGQWREEGTPFDVTFIDGRYRQEDLCQRIRLALPACEQLHFHAPGGGQAAFLERVADLDAVVDTWPYSGGLTTVEAYAVGVPTFTRPGELFCERHTWAHARHARLPANRYQLDRLGPLRHLKQQEAKVMPTKRLPRHHQKLATQLLAHMGL